MPVVYIINFDFDLLQAFKNDFVKKDSLIIAWMQLNQWRFFKGFGVFVKHSTHSFENVIKSKIHSSVHIFDA